MANSKQVLYANVVWYRLSGLLSKMDEVRDSAGILDADDGTEAVFYYTITECVATDIDCMQTCVLSLTLNVSRVDDMFMYRVLLECISVYYFVLFTPVDWPGADDVDFAKPAPPKALPAAAKRQTKSAGPSMSRSQPSAGECVNDCVLCTHQFAIFGQCLLK